MFLNNFKSKISGIFNDNTLISILALTLSFVVINGSYFPYLGFCLAGMAIATLIFSYTNYKNTPLYFYFIAMLCSLFFFTRSDISVLWLASAGYCYSIAFMGLPKGNNFEDKWWYTSLAPFIYLIIVLKTVKDRSSKNLLENKLDKKEKTSFKDRLFNLFNINNFKTIFINTIAVILILIIVIPLLSSTNPFFSDIFSRFYYNFINPLLTFIFSGLIFIRLIFWFVVYNFLVRAKKLASAKFEIIDDLHKDINLTIAKSSLVFILFVYFVSQIQLYTTTNLDKISKNVNEIFLQLSVVSVIVFLIIYFDLMRTKISKILSYTLLGFCFLLLVIAFSSDYQYMANFGLTQKRLLGIAIIFVLIGWLSVYITGLTGILRGSKKDIPKRMLSVVVLTIVFLGFINFNDLVTPDYSRVYSYFISSEDNNLDKQHEYWTNFNIKQEKDYNPCTNQYSNGAYEVNFQLENLQNKYENIGWNLFSFNLREYNTYNKIKNLKPIRVFDTNNFSCNQKSY
jgi:Domain of unknown function (DUF4173)